MPDGVATQVPGIPRPFQLFKNPAVYTYECKMIHVRIILDTYHPSNERGDVVIAQPSITDRHGLKTCSILWEETLNRFASTDRGVCSRWRQQGRSSSAIQSRCGPRVPLAQAWRPDVQRPGPRLARTSWFGRSDVDMWRYNRIRLKPNGRGGILPVILVQQRGT